MKNRSKILLALLIVLTLMVGIFAITANAAETTTVYVKDQRNWGKVNVYWWGGSTACSGMGTAMTYNSETGLYEGQVPSDCTGFLFNNGNWGGTNQTPDLKIPADENHVFTNKGTYTVAGNNTTILGTSWDVTNTDNDLSYDTTTDLLTKVYWNAPKTSFGFKVAYNHSWDTSWPGSNKYVSISDNNCKLVITFNNNTNVVTANAYNHNYVHGVCECGDVNVTGLEGAGTEADPYTIHNIHELGWFRDQVDLQLSDGSTQFTGKYFKLTADIDLAGINWNPIGSMTGDHGSFKGVFDGDNHTISNLYVEQAGNGLGLFARTAGNAEINNLKLVNVTIKSTDNSNYLGGLVGNAYASTHINNVHVSGDILVSGRGYIGGIAGHGYVVMDNVSVVGNEGSLITSTFWCAGGVLGYGGEGATNIMNAHVEGVTITSAAGGLGAIVGMAEDNNGTQPISGSNLSASNVEIKTYVGAYGDAYANYALGYLYGGNPTSELTGNLVVENVKVETSTGETPEINDAVASVNGTVYFDYDEAFKAAVNGDTVTIVKPGTYKLAVSGKSITVTGAVDGVVFEGMGAYNMGSASVTFNNVTFNWTNENYTGLQHSGDLVYNNCTINGQPFLYGTSETFNECTFNQESSEAYNVWTYGAKKVTFNKCTFNSAGKSVLVYTEAAEHFIDLAVTETTFNASSTVDGKAAIEIDTSLSAGANISVDGATTATGFDEGSVSGNTLYNNKKGNEGVNNDINITVNDEVVLEVIKTAEVNGVYYTTIAAALAAAKDGDKVYIYAGEYTQSISVNKAITVIGETDAEGNNLVKLNGGISITKDGATVKNITASNPSTSGYNMTLSISGKDILVEGCVITDYNGVRYASASGLVTFKNCVITGTVYGIHFDGKAGGEIVIEGCTITGWTSFASTINKVVMKETTFEKGNYNYVRFYQEEIVLEGCTFNEEMVVDIASSAAGASVTVNDCTIENGTVADLFEESDLKDCEVVVDEDRLYPIVAKVNGEDFRGASIQDAIKAAAPNGTVDIIEDVVIDKWIMFAQNLTIGNGSLITLDMSGLTINGNGHKLTVNSIESAKNGNRLFYGANELHINDWTIEIAEGVNGGVSLASGSLNNVHFIGGVNQVLAGSGNITISGCTFENSIGHAIYTDENSGNLAIDGCKFMENGSGYAVVLRTAESSFTNNICSVKLNLYADGVAENVTGNTFDSRVKLYTNGETLSGNVFTENGYIAVESSDLIGIDVSGNYWGGENPVNLPANVICDSYYTSINADGTLGDCVEVVVYVIDADGSLSHYGDIQAAFDAAVDGDVVVVNYDLVLSGAVVVDGKDITLNLNGKTLSLAGEVATYSLDSVGTVIAAIGGANLKIDGNGNVIANADGGIFYEEDGSNIEIVSGNFHGVDSIDAYLAAGFRAVKLEDTDGNVYFGVAANDATVYIGTNGNWWVGDYDTGVGAHPVVTIQMVTDRPGYEPGYYWFINGKFSGEAYAVDGINPTITIGADGYWYVDFDGEGVRNPVKGESAVAVDGYSVTGIAKDEENSVDNIDVYIITYSNGVDERTSKFIIVNGIDGQQGEPGDKGEQGVQGAPGDKGDPGTNGNSNTWLVEIVVISSVVCILVAVGVVLVLNKKRLSWWA